MPRKLKVQPKKKEKLTIKCDELWSFVDNKGNQQWVWLAMEVEAREILVLISAHGMKKQLDICGSPYLGLIVNVPLRSVALAVSHTLIFGLQERGVLPSKRHQAVGKKTGKTSDIERFNNTLRQRVSRLVRKTLSFSK
ncbi:MAG: hypothetical protein F6K08_35600 [Okeania sp. SIO1H6]|uniref:IS1 family transposase n=1 Tax=Okeania TaxID=1458928 RepID=UPI001374C236|nr:hypothetical protein [Okeania sp. SIO1H4]NES92608.1 hypothetical protein [Okeania sp. SIO2B9]NET17776.1 hypothetical protein [Okeania sp. SIO1H6]NET74848.1 hypothetical protein [Okeania sp. SIO1F9]